VLIVCDGITCVSRDDSCIIVSGFTLKFSHVNFLSCRYSWVLCCVHSSVSLVDVLGNVS
jgi:hypothetical protein